MIKEPDILVRQRKSFLTKFKELPMPSPMDEPWRYTNVLDLNLNKFDITGQVIDFSELNGLMDSDVIFTDIKTAIKNHFQIIAKHLPMGLVKEEDKFIAMHGAFWNDGIFIYIPENVNLELPLKNLFKVTGKGGVFSHTIIILEKNSSLTYIEEHISNKGEYLCLRNDVVEIYSKENSSINFYNLQNWHSNVMNISNWKVKLDRNSKINWVFGQFGGNFSRIKIDTLFSEQGSESEKTGIFFTNKNQKYDFTTNALHTVPNTRCNILVKGVLDDKSSSVYRGMIKITNEAQHTTSYLADHSLFLSDDAISNSVPSLEIDANDVRASHGATLGQLDEEQIFYLMSRGLSRKEAEQLLISGYFQPIIDKINDKNLRKRFQDSVKLKIEK